MSIQLELPFPPEVEWRDVPGFEGKYQVSNTGLIRRGIPAKNKKTGELMKTRANRQGYRCISLTLNGKRFYHYVHSLVMLVFVGVRPAGHQVNHKNGDKTDNRIENLEYCTMIENVMHSIIVLGYNSIGTNNPSARLNDDQVREIRRIRKETNLTRRQIASQFNVSMALIDKIVSRQVWKHIQ